MLGTDTRRLVQRRIASQARAAYSWSWWLLPGLMLLSLGLRIWFISVNQLDPTYSPTDDGDYYRRAFRFATTGAYVDDFWCIRPPLHVFMFAGTLRLSMLTGVVDGILLTRIVQMVLSVLTIPIGYDLARRLFNRRTGLIFAGILAVWFPLVELPAHFFSEPLFFFLIVVHFWLLICWRDTRHWPLLAGAGATLGMAALTRSSALYATAFVVLWLLLQALDDQRRCEDAKTRRREVDTLKRFLITLSPRHLLTVSRNVLPHSLIFLLGFAAVIAPWTIRNYMVYEQFMLIDSTGPILMWLRVSENGSQGTEILRSMSQAERLPFVNDELSRIMAETPYRFLQLVWGQSWEHFREVWKAQFTEEFLNQPEFYVRPLRELWVLGGLGDLLWLAFTLAGLVALVAPRPGDHFRWLALAWIAYMLVSVMIWHPEPRYMLPAWLLLALYGAWALGNLGGTVARLRQQRWRALAAMALVIGFAALFLSYRDYPQLIARGFRREWHLSAGARAYAMADDATALREWRAALDAQPNFIESRSRLALALIAHGQVQEAEALLREGDDQQLDLARGALARSQGDLERAATLFTEAEIRGSADVQTMALSWLRPPTTTALSLGDGRDLGYVRGFSPGEQLSQPNGALVSYRWLQGEGKIVLPLTQPLDSGNVVLVQMSAGRPEGTQLSVRLHDQVEPKVLRVDPAWRTYRLVVPSALAGQQQLTLTLDAPTFIPARRFAGSNDLRALSVMVSEVQVR